MSADGTVTETVTVKRKTYPQRDWSAYRESQHHEKDYVERLLRDLCVRISQPPRKPGPGRNRRLLADLVFEAVMKMYTGLPGSRLIPDLEASAANGYLSTVGHENSIHNFLASEESTPLLIALIEESSIPLGAIENGQYAIDSTGMSPATYDRYFSFKHGGVATRHQWVKLHIMAGTATHVISGVKVSPAGDCPQLVELLAQTRKHHVVRELSADKAYSSIENHEVWRSWASRRSFRSRTTP